MIKEVLVTGAAGYIGSHVCHELLKAGHRVYGVDDLSTGFREFVNPGITFHQIQIQDTSALQNVFGKLNHPEMAGVIHCAGLKFAGESVKFPLKYFENNTSAVISMLEIMQEFGVNKLVFSSSCSVYGSLSARESVTEDSPLTPVSPYGRSKLFAESIIRDQIASLGLRALVLRYFNVVGNAEIAAKDKSPFNLFPNLFRAASENSVFKVFGDTYDTPDGSCIRDYVDVRSLAKAHVSALEKLNSGFNLDFAYNLASGKGASVFEIIKTLESLLSKPIKLEIVAPRPGDPARILGNSSRASRDLGWDSAFSISELVKSSWGAWNSKL